MSAAVIGFISQLVAKVTIHRVVPVAGMEGSDSAAGCSNAMFRLGKQRSGYTVPAVCGFDSESFDGPASSLLGMTCIRMEADSTRRSTVFTGHEMGGMSRLIPFVKFGAHILEVLEGGDTDGTCFVRCMVVIADLDAHATPCYAGPSCPATLPGLRRARRGRNMTTMLRGIG